MLAACSSVHLLARIASIFGRSRMCLSQVRMVRGVTSFSSASSLSVRRAMGGKPAMATRES